MPKDLSTELDLAFWEAWFLEEALKVPHTRDSWSSHCLDSLQAFTMGGEL